MVTGSDEIPVIEFVGVDKQPQEPIVEKPRRTRKPTTKSPSRPPPNLEKKIAAQLVSINFILLALPMTRNDALSTAEIEALAKAINHQAQQSNYFRKAVEGALAVSSAGELLSVIMMIAVKRASNHGYIPEAYSEMATMLMLPDDEMVNDVEES